MPSTHILIATVGSHGDAHPFAGLGAELHRRGHRVCFLANELYRPMAEQLGLEFVPLGTADEFRAAIANRDVWHPRKGLKAVAKFATEITHRTYEQAVRLYEPGTTVGIASSLAMGMRVAQEKIGMPLATVHLAPVIFRTLHQTPNLSPLPLYPWQPRWMKRAIYSLMDAMAIDPALARPVNAFRKTIGMPPIRRVLNWMNSPDLVLGMFPDWFAPRQPDWPAHLQLTGFPLYDERDLSVVDASLLQFMQSETRPIVFTPGSAMVYGHTFFLTAVEVCKRLNRRGLLLTRYSEQIPAGLPDSIRHCSFTPLSVVLPHAAAIVHHGGIGTMSQAFAAGIPQLVMPMSHDQPDNATRAARLGVASIVTGRRFNANTATAALKSLLDNSTVSQRCATVAAMFKGVDGIRHAADAIESQLIPRC